MRNQENLQSIQPLSPLQHGMLFHAIKDPASTAYVQQDELRIVGELDLALFERSLQMLVERYDILRTNFVYQKIQIPRQVVFKVKNLKVHFTDISEMPAEDRELVVAEFKEADRKRGFDLTRDNLMRVAVFRLTQERYSIIWSHHHIIMDGWCRGIVFRDFFTIYGALKQRVAPALGKVYPYGQYLDWLKRQDHREAKEYWKRYLAGYQQRVYPPGHRRRVSGSAEYEVEEQVLEIDAIRTRALEEVARRLKVTVNAVFETVWGILLQRYNHTQDVVFGAVVSGRSPEVEGIDTMVGLFINTIPVRVRSSQDQFFSDVVQQVHAAGVESRGYDYLSLAEIQAESLQGAEINNLMVFENFPAGLESDEALARETGFMVMGLEHAGHTNYDFNLRLSVEETIRVDFTYNRLVYEPAYIAMIKGHMLTLLDSIVRDATVAVKDLEIFAEKAELLADFNRPLVLPHVMEQSFQARFYRMVDRDPDKPVVERGGVRITYQELDQSSNRIANYLLERGLTGEAVGVLTGVRSQMITATLGILKAGAIFVPLDPSYPRQRLQTMVDIAEPALLLVDPEHVALAMDLAGLYEVIEEIPCENVARPTWSPRPDDAVYIYFTSGSTGQPKGIVGRYESLLQVITWEIEQLGFTNADRFSQLTSPSFDPYLRDILPPLCVGGTICIPERRDLLLDGVELARWIDSTGISVMHCIPSLFKLLNQAGLYPGLFPGLRYVCLAGERINPKMLGSWYAVFGERVQLVNLYGPTETTLFKTSYRIQPSDVDKWEIPLGKPVDGSSLIILDEDGKICGRGVIGEIYIRTAYGTHGYLNNPQAMERFVVNPFSAEESERLYRTGDLGRLLPDGNYEYAGRADHQVKIRGVRIELREIESQLLGHAQVKEAVVIVRADANGEQVLCAFLEVQEGAGRLTGLREYLKSRLPETMIPAYFVVVDALPLSPNGKIDRSALPDHTTNLLRESEYEPPANAVERSLVKIYSELLGVEPVGVNDAFVDLGGHSLKVMELIPRVYKELGVELTVRDVIQHSTIRELAEKIALVKTAGLVAANKQYTLFNEGVAANLFCFPPRSGLGVVYQGLAEMLPSHSVYGFDFLDTEDFLEEYFRIIVELQPAGPYRFLGHSIGGSLAFEMAKLMQERGYEVADLIMLDTMKYEAAVELTPEKLEEEVTHFFDLIDQQGGFIRDFIQLVNVRAEMEKKVRGYTRFKYRTVNSGQIGANIHYLRAEGSERSGWEQATTGRYLEYAGFGSHSLMLSGEHLQKNLVILKEILTNL